MNGSKAFALRLFGRLTAQGERRIKKGVPQSQNLPPRMGVMGLKRVQGSPAEGMGVPPSPKPSPQEWGARGVENMKGGENGFNFSRSGQAFQ